MALILRPSISGGPIFGAAISGVPIVGGLGVAYPVEADDFVSASGLLALSATSSLTEAADLLSSASALALTGAGAITEAGDTLSSAAGLAIIGAASVSEIDDIVASVGGLVIGAALAKTEDNDTLVATASTGISGQLVTPVRRGGLSAYAISSNAISGKSAIRMFLSREDSDTLSSAAALAIVGSAALIEASDTSTGRSGARPVFHVITGGGGSRLRVVTHSGGPRLRLGGLGVGTGLRLRA